MPILIIILVLIAVLAAFPVVRDYIKKKRTVSISYTEGLAAMLDQKPEQAIEFLTQSVATDSNNVDAYLRLADLYYQKGDQERSTKIYERLAVRHNMTPDEEKKVYQNLGYYYLAVGRNQKAISMFEELINIDRQNIKNYEALLSLYYKTERWQDCEALLKKIEKVQSDKNRLAQYYIEFGKQIFAKSPDSAISHYKQALAYNRKSADGLIVLGEYYYKKGEIDVAIKIWNEFLEYYPQKNYLVRRQLEQAYYDLNQYDEVVNLYEKLLKKAPDDIGLYVVMAQINEKKQDLNSAIRILNKIPAEKKKEVLPQIELAKLYLLNNEIKKAQQVMEALSEQLKQK
jgi:lipopolysaccharide biosynthesis regulator YciM